MPSMLILRGKAGPYKWKGVNNWPDGALDQPPALEYARLRGFSGYVLPVAGYTSDTAPQVTKALEELKGDDSYTALYGFSAGGYNLDRIIKRMSKEQKDRLDLVIVLGAPGMSMGQIRSGKWELVYRDDPPAGHMAGPDALLADWKKSHP